MRSAYHIRIQPLRLPILRHLGRGSAEIDLRAYGQEATLWNQATPTGYPEYRQRGSRGRGGLGTTGSPYRVAPTGKARR